MKSGKKFEMQQRARYGQSLSWQILRNNMAAHPLASGAPFDERRFDQGRRIMRLISFPKPNILENSYRYLE
jgi:hypothetical protein